MPKYDVAIVGAGIAGLCTAALLANAGKKVFLTDPSDRAGGAVASIKKDGFHFAAGPNITYGFEQGGPLRNLYSLLGFVHGESASGERYQVVLPDRRVTIFPENRETLDELRREFPREIDKLMLLYRDAGRTDRRIATSRLSSYLANRRPAASLLNRHRFSSNVTAYFDVQSRFFFGRPVAGISARSLVQLLVTPPRAIPGGANHLADQLLLVLQQKNTRVLMGETWPEMLFRGRKISGIRTPQGVIEARSFILNASWKPGERTLLYGVRSEVIPVGMENTALCLHDYQRPDDWFSLAISPQDRIHAAPAGMRTLTASFPAREETPESSERLEDRIQAVIPFLSEHTVATVDQVAAARLFTLPEQIAMKQGTHAGEPSIPAPCPIRNLTVFPDSSRTLLQSLRSAHMVAAKLS